MIHLKIFALPSPQQWLFYVRDLGTKGIIPQGYTIIISKGWKLRSSYHALLLRGKTFWKGGVLNLIWFKLNVLMEDFCHKTVARGCRTKSSGLSFNIAMPRKINGRIPYLVMKSILYKINHPSPTIGQLKNLEYFKSGFKVSESY